MNLPVPTRREICVCNLLRSGQRATYTLDLTAKLTHTKRFNLENMITIIINLTGYIVYL